MNPKEIKKLMEICKTSSENEFRDCAYVALAWMIQETQKGNRIGSINKKTGVFTGFTVALLRHVDEIDKVTKLNVRKQSPRLKLVDNSDKNE